MSRSCDATAKIRHREVITASILMSTTMNGTYQLQGMSCGNCAKHAERVAQHIDGVTGASVDLAQQTISISFDQPIDEKKLSEAFDKIGYSAVTRLAELSIDEMKCNGCVKSVNEALMDAPGVLHVNVDLADGKATVKYWQGRTSPEQLASIVNELGFPTTLTKTESDAA